MKKILVTGSNGFLGQKITQRFLALKDFELIATSKGDNRFPVKDGYTYFNLDLTDHWQVSTLLKDVGPDVVINTAAMALPDQCEQNKEQCELLNSIAVKHLAQVCSKLEIHLVHLSTDFIFDGTRGPYREDDVPNPLSFYGQSKLAGEKWVRLYCERWTIIRTVLVYGFVPGHSRSNIVLWVKSSLEKGIPIRVVSDQWRSPTLADDLADGCVRAALHGKSGIFHMAGNEQMSVYELASKVAEFWKLDDHLVSPVLTSSLNEVAKRPLLTGFISDRALQELQFSPRTLNDGLMLMDKQLSEIL